MVLRIKHNPGPQRRTHATSPPITTLSHPSTALIPAHSTPRLTSGTSGPGVRRSRPHDDRDPAPPATQPRGPSSKVEALSVSKEDEFLCEYRQASFTLIMKMSSTFRVHGALIAVQLIFGGGSVVGKLGIASFNPMVFALIREASAGMLLLMCALRVDGRRRLPMRDAPVFFFCGLFVFFNQACFIVGAKLAGAVLASSWQPTQPVFTLLISVALGWERLTLFKAAGILLSLAGAAWMALPGSDLTGSGVELLVGNVLFFFNCLGTSLYVITSKVAFSRGYPPTTVTAYSYLCGALLMSVTAVAFSSSCQLVQLLCPASDDGPVFHCGTHIDSRTRAMGVANPHPHPHSRTHPRPRPRPVTLPQTHTDARASHGRCRSMRSGRSPTGFFSTRVLRTGC